MDGPAVLGPAAPGLRLRNLSPSVSQALQLENRKLLADLDGLRAEEQQKDQKLQKLL